MKSAVLFSIVLISQISGADPGITFCENEIQRVMLAMSDGDSDCLNIANDIFVLRALVQSNRIQEACAQASPELKKEGILTRAQLRKELALAHRTQRACAREQL